MQQAVGSVSSHLWACDSRLGVYFLREINVHLEAHSFPGSQLSPTPPCTPIWEKVEGHLDLISCGCSSLVCGVSKSVIYLRKGITHDNPVGVSWIKGFCDVVAIATGNKCIVRRTSSGSMFFTRVGEFGEMTVFIPSWTLIPACPFEGELEHFSLDEDNNLYVVARSGEVFSCTGLTLSDATQWTHISKAPPVSRKGALSWVKSFWQEQNEDAIASVSAGRQCLWCLKDGGQEVWQLVLGYLTTSSGEQELRTNWVKFVIPTECDSLCGDRYKTDVIYALNKARTNVVMFSLEQKQVFPITLANPVGRSESALWKSIAVSQTSIPLLGNSPKKPEQAAPTVYPKLPKDEDYDVCCENGDCEFCRSAGKSSVIMAVIRNDDMEVTLVKPKAPSSSSGIGSKRGHPSLIGGAVSLGAEASFFTCQEEFAVPAKRHRVSQKSKLNRYWLLEGVDVFDRHAEIAQQFVPAHTVAPMATSRVDTKYLYSFALEHQVLKSYAKDSERPSEL